MYLFQTEIKFYPLDIAIVKCADRNINVLGCNGESCEEKILRLSFRGDRFEKMFSHCPKMQIFVYKIFVYNVQFLNFEFQVLFPKFETKLTSWQS